MSRSSARYEKPVVTSAWGSDVHEETEIGRPSQLAPPPRWAEKSSPRKTSTTAPETISPSIAAATLTAKTGTP